MAATQSIENGYFSVNFNKHQQVVKTGLGPGGRRFNSSLPPIQKLLSPKKSGLSGMFGLETHGTEQKSSKIVL
jgi:hypothetical protein